MNVKNVVAVFFIVLVGAAFYSATLKAVVGNVDAQSGLPNDPSVFGSIGPYESSHERSSFAVVLAMASYHDVSLTQPLADFGSPDVGYYKGKFYSFFPPGLAVLGYPLYLLGQHFNLAVVFTYGLVPVMSICALIVLFFICRHVFKFSASLSVIAVTILGIGTIFWNYSITLYQHIPTILLLFGSFYSAWRFRQGGRTSWVWAVLVWTCYALGPLFDYPNLMLLLPVIVYFFASSVTYSKPRSGQGFTVGIQKAFVFGAIAAVLVFGAQLYYNYRVFGNWKIYSNVLPRYDQKTYSYTQLSSQDTEQIAAQKSEVSSIFREVNLPNGIYILTVSVDKGLFLYMPIFLLSLLGMYVVRKKITYEIATLLGVVGVNLLLYASFGDPWGGLSYGPRYLLPSIAVLPIFIGLWISSLGKFEWLGRIATFALFAYSSGVALLGAVTRNVVFPKNEALYVDTSNKFWFNFHFLKLGQSGSVAYNALFAGHMSLATYYIVLYVATLFIGAVAMLVVPEVGSHTATREEEA